MLRFIGTIKFNFKANFFIGLFLFGLCFFVSDAKASATSTLRGSAWWGDEKGYVYFNCKDYVVGDHLDVLENLSGSGKYLPPDDKFHFFSPKCLGFNHAVYIDSQGNLRGQAWNQLEGFISFSGTSTPPEGYGAFNSNCSNLCDSSNSCWSCYNESEKKIYGWARVDSSGEWIRLDNTGRLYLETCSSDPQILSSENPRIAAIGLEPGDFFGYGKSTSTPDNLYFNCKADESDSCASRDYKVYVETLTVGALTAPNFSYAQACGSNALGATLGWCVKSGHQTAYEVVVSDTNFGSSPTSADLNSAFCWTGKINSDSANQFLPHISCPRQLEYGTDYYWWIRLYDESNEATQWYQYYGNTTNDTDGDADRLYNVNHEKTFSTFKHPFPNPFFTWSPYEILVGSSTAFTAASSTFYISGQAEPQSCYGQNCRYAWTTTDAKAIFSSTSERDIDITFKIATDTTVSLAVTDADNYTCSMTSALITINYDLPIWREIKAK